MPAKTPDQIRGEFLDCMHSLADYWATLPDKTPHERVHGFGHSVLCLLDGVAAAMPGFVLLPSPHPDDKASLEADGEDWYPSPPEGVGDGIHNGQYLHDLWYQVSR